PAFDWAAALDAAESEYRRARRLVGAGAETS
ncbi:MAG: hypothetical protein JWP95_520, partial [Actinotalea sp.]|nr:hypothetical protein [Actinotalea sp.]